MRGQKVKTLLNEVMTAGNHTISWTGKDEQAKEVGSGIYFYKMETNECVQFKKAILMK
jgi:flagellar hook assembly protein FlgD